MLWAKWGSSMIWSLAVIAPGSVSRYVAGHVPEVPCADPSHRVCLDHPPSDLPDVRARRCPRRRSSIAGPRPDRTGRCRRRLPRRSPRRRRSPPTGGREPGRSRSPLPRSGPPRPRETRSGRRSQAPGWRRRSGSSRRAGERVTAARASARTSATTSTAASWFGSAIVPRRRSRLDAAVGIRGQAEIRSAPRRSHSRRRSHRPRPARPGAPSRGRVRAPPRTRSRRAARRARTGPGPRTCRSSPGPRASSAPPRRGTRRRAS